MVHLFLIVFILFFLLASFAASIAIGRNIGRAQLRNKEQNKLEIIGVAESAVFGLLALLIAFTFSGAYDRYESRKTHLVEEANTFQRAYDYIDLTPADMQPKLRSDLRNYLDIYLKIFDDIPHTDKVNADLEIAQNIEDGIWKDAIKACDELSNKTLAQIYLPGISDMFDAAHTGYFLTQIHPPIIIFALLITLAILGAFLVGYTSAESTHDWPLHSVCYVLLTAFTIYIIINMEYPRVGFLGLNNFDHILVSVREHMQ